MRFQRAAKHLWPLAAVLFMSSPARAATPDPTNELRGFVQQFLSAANQLDIASLAEMYAPGSSTTVVNNGTITYGWGAIQEQAKRSIGAAVRDSFDISIEDMRVTPLGPQDAYVVTPVTVIVRSDAGVTERHGGALTLVLEKRAGKWLILHDHTAFNCKP